MCTSAVKQVIAINEDETARLDGRRTGPAPELATSGSNVVRAVRRRLPVERRAVTHHFSIAGQEGYLTVGVYEDGLPGEIFVRMAKEGSTVSGLMDAFATVVSLALQNGVPLSVLCGKLSYMRFEPSGWSGNPNIGFAKSLMDYIARWLELKFLNNEQGELFAPLVTSGHASSTAAPDKEEVMALSELVQLGDAPACNVWGALMVRSGPMLLPHGGAFHCDGFGTLKPGKTVQVRSNPLTVKLQLAEPRPQPLNQMLYMIRKQLCKTT